MQVSMAMEANAAPSSTSIASPNPTSDISPLPTPQSQLHSTQTQLHFSAGQKRPSESDALSTSILSNINESTLTTAPTDGDNKENTGGPSELKNLGSIPTATQASLPIHTSPGLVDHPTPNASNEDLSQAENSGLGTPPAAKKRKLSPASREAKQQEKEAKERQRLEEKAKKDEEKAKKDEEKRKRDAEKEEERKKREEKKKAKEEEKAAREAAKEEEKRKKEEEKRKKEEEKLKKERAQTKLNSFFAKPKPTTEKAQLTNGAPNKVSTDGASVGSSENAGEPSAYKSEFPDFFLQSHTSLAPPHRFERDAQALAHLQAKVDSYLSSPNPEPLVFRPSELFRMMPYKRRHGYQKMSVKDILLQMQTLHDVPETSEAARKLRDSLKQVKMKSLRFGEDVRPPYQGTYSKHLPREAASRLMRNPFRRELPEVNYDYDSEAEWEEPEEGEELDSEEEEEGSEEGDDDMDGFLDDEDDQLADNKRRLLVGDLEPICTGIRWQDEGPNPELDAYQLETIFPSVTFPIDPFSSSYWQKPKAPEPSHNNGVGRTTLHSFMGNPALPTPGPLAMQDGSTVAAGKPKRAFPAEQLGEFKAVVEGSDLTKMGLIEILKKRFPKVSKDTLKATLDSTAKRVGHKESDKKWVCI
ncbi:chromatin assembly factor 1 subunit A-domain-containing protein [Aspergillus egyptiacus]|nr:chromatin assembly factor 1 subunit A-domain-containing protein [Aspergillus egyptiacus]